MICWCLVAVTLPACAGYCRDLHWGNVLVKTTKQKTGSFLLNGTTHSLETKGVLVRIIDYSLSRLEIGQIFFHPSLSIQWKLCTFWLSYFICTTYGLVYIINTKRMFRFLQMNWRSPVISRRMRSFSWAREITSLKSTDWWERRTGQCIYVSVTNLETPTVSLCCKGVTQSRLMMH